jgi:hypothetical protein
MDTTSPARFADAEPPKAADALARGRPETLPRWPEYMLLRPPAVGDNSAMQIEPPKVDPPKRKRRWFQFSLVLLSALLIPLGWCVNEVRIAQERKALLIAIHAQGGEYQPFIDAKTSATSFVRRWSGYLPIVVIWLPKSVTTRTERDSSGHSRKRSSSWPMETHQRLDAIKALRVRLLRSRCNDLESHVLSIGLLRLPAAADNAAMQSEPVPPPINRQLAAKIRDRAQTPPGGGDGWMQLLGPMLGRSAARLWRLMNRYSAEQMHPQKRG